MSLSPGNRLAHYEILSPLGAGGMGEVYRARDQKLDREVAVKVLPSSLAEDADALARFEREAKAVAALSHPAILAIHDFGSEGGTAYAVMELLEGKTLRERLAEGALPVRKAGEYGLQIAQALAAAHTRGIVHRDLKPENIFVTRDGQVKVLDFGLAKQDTAGPTTDDSRSPTVAPPTDPGTVMGTAGYMSPEQVRGQPVDARSDIFSFGAVLYEMLSGERAFRRDTTAETMTAILREEPPELHASVEGLPAAFARVVQHCLEKQADERFQSARDLAFDLSSLTDSQVRHERLPEGGAMRRLDPRVVTPALVLVAAVAGLVIGRSWTPVPERVTTKAAALSFVQLTDQPGVEKDPVLSPDGKSIVYAADAAGSTDLFLLRVGGRNPVNLTADSEADDHQPALSPNGDRIAFRSERDGGGIFVMGSTGESVKRVTDFGWNPTWSPDGKEIAVSEGAFSYATDRSSYYNDIWAVDVETGQRRQVTRDGDAMQPHWSPHGDRIAYWGLRGTSGQRDLWTVAADGSEAGTEGVEATNDAPLDWSPTWSPSGEHLYFSSSRGGTMNLWRLAIDEKTGQVLGAPEPVTTPSQWSGQASLSGDGLQLAFATLDWRTTLLQVGFDPTREVVVGSPTPVLKSTRTIRDHSVSPDGEWIAFNHAGVREDILVARLDGRQYRRLTDDTFRDRGPLWAPEGQRIAFYSDRSGGYEIWTIRPDGSGLEQLTHGSQESMNFPVWSPDGSRIASATIPGNWQLLEVDGETGAVDRKVMPLSNETQFWPLDWSSDGRLLAGLTMKDERGARVAIYSLETQELAEAPGDSGLDWQAPVWLSDSRRLLVRDRKGVALVEPARGRIKRLLDVRGYMIGRSVGVTPDDRWITYTETATEGDIWLMNLGNGGE